VTAAPRFAIESSDGGLRDAVRAVSARIGLSGSAGRSVFLKPNFTYPFPKEGVTTSRAFIEAVVVHLRELGVERVCLGEGEGGYNAFSMDETFVAFGLDDLTARYGLEVVNLNRWPSTELEVEGRRGRWQVAVPTPVLEEFDTFLTLPVPKVHSMTRMSGAVKNQWGVVQDPMRLALHCGFEEILTALTARLPNPHALVDGSWGLTGNGPMIEGEAIELGWVAGADDLWLCDAVLCRIMGQPPAKVQPLGYAMAAGLVPALDDAELPDDLDRFVDDRFYLRRNVWNRVAKTTWYSPRLNHLVYFSKASGMLHRVMYAVRRKPDELAARGVDW
jgi:uncharacterized protein (DUF362 family)